MRITTNGTTISGSLSEVLATLTHITQLGANAPVTAKPVTTAEVTETAVTGEPGEVAAKAVTAEIHAGETVTPKPVPVPKPARDSVIKRAISDVEDLLSRDYYSVGVGKTVRAHVGASVDFVIGAGSDRVDFFINADKKTVVAKLFINSPGFSKTVTRQSYATQGRAKCAPGDVFNEHIGKAIALRRALGLEVPVEYFTVEARDRDDLAVGDVVRGDIDKKHYDILKFIGRPALEAYTGKIIQSKQYPNSGYLRGDEVTLINDSARHTAPDLEVSRIIRH